MQKEIVIHFHLINLDKSIFIEAISELNNLQDIIYFNTLSYAPEEVLSEYELTEFYKNVISLVKEKNELPNLITVTNTKIYRITNDNSIGCHFANSYQMGVVSLKKSSTFAYFKYELMRTGIQLSLQKYFEHNNEGCFFDVDTNLYNTSLCDYCEKQCLKSGVSMRELHVLKKILNSLKNEFLGIEESNLFSVIIMDIVGYSKFTDTRQKSMIIEFQNVIKDTEMIVNNLESIIFLPTGDGCIIALDDKFFRYSVKLCVELQKKMTSCKLQVRYGINIGNVFKYRDINNNINIAGSGINFAARVMDVGDENHIIANRTIFDQLCNIDDWHRNIFHFIGSVSVKHGEKLDLFNIFSEEESFGNSAKPKKLKE